MARMHSALQRSIQRVVQRGLGHLGIGLAGLCLAGAAQALTLYDPALGLPSAQGWLSTGVGSATQGITGGQYSLDTSASLATQWGNARTLTSTPLDTVAGFTLDFTVRILGENHGSNTNRAGFSLIFVGQDPTHSLELAFWTDSVWAYHYDTNQSAFVHGASAALNTGPSRNYSLQVLNQQFSLLSGSTVLLSGPLENYTAQGLPYTTPNFLFFGDDTSSASASVRVGQITLTPVPEPAPATLALVGAAFMAWRLRAAARRP